MRPHHGTFLYPLDVPHHCYYMQHCLSLIPRRLRLALPFPEQFPVYFQAFPHCYIPHFDHYSVQVVLRYDQVPIYFFVLQRCFLSHKKIPKAHHYFFSLERCFFYSEPNNLWVLQLFQQIEQNGLNHRGPCNHLNYYIPNHYHYLLDLIAHCNCDLVKVFPLRQVLVPLLFAMFECMVYPFL